MISTGGDLDLDGDLDLFRANWQNEDLLFLKEGGGNFEQMAIDSSGLTSSTSVALADYDGDGDLVGTISSRTAMGAKVKVVNGTLVQERELCDDACGPGTNVFGTVATIMGERPLRGSISTGLGPVNSVRRRE